MYYKAMDRCKGRVFFDKGDTEPCGSAVVRAGFCQECFTKKLAGLCGQVSEHERQLILLRAQIAALEATPNPKHITVRVDQIWAYQRTSPTKLPPVTHILTRVDGENLDARSVYMDPPSVRENVVINREGGHGLTNMLRGFDDVGTWTLLFNPPA